MASGFQSRHVYRFRHALSDVVFQQRHGWVLSRVRYCKQFIRGLLKTAARAVASLKRCLSFVQFLYENGLRRNVGKAWIACESFVNINLLAENLVGKNFRRAE